jgi:nucleotide-binding universal stress UspA family protein
MNSYIRQILVHLDPTAGAMHRLSVAREIAQQHGAQVAALYAVTPTYLELPYAPEIGPSLAADLVKMDDERRAKVMRDFDAQMRQLGPDVSWAQSDEGTAEISFAQQARFADLLVLGQPDASDPVARCVPPDFVPDVLSDTGRPALVVPYIGMSAAPNGTVAVAWKDTPQAVRALAAAMPFLARASQVHILTWGTGQAAQLSGKALSLDHYLKVHGVSATWHRDPGEPRDLGDLLMSRVSDLGADLLVMGCYGHSRAREWVMGGVTRTVLQSMTVPVLMSH